MQEPSPHISEEVRMLLSQYLDGELDEAGQKRAEEMIAANTAIREEYARLKILHSAVQNSTEKTLHYNRVTDSLWNRISSQLEADQKQSPERFDEVFISSYYDGEIPSSDPDFKRFESQLYNNAEANRTLAAIGEISEAVRNFGYRLEESCTLDITQAVMERYLSETGGQDLESAALPPELEVLSAYVDKELSAKETIEANKLIEGNAQHQQTIRVFTRLSEAIQDISTQLQAQAPKVWPHIEKELSNVIPLTAKKTGNVIPMKKIAMTASVAAVLLLVAIPLFQGGLTPTGRLAASQAKEIASVPASSANYMRANFQDLAAPDAGAPAEAEAKSVEPTSEEVLVNLSKADKERYNPKDIPSAEEFLFSDMEQSAGDSGQVIVGQD